MSGYESASLSWRPGGPSSGRAFLISRGKNSIGKATAIEIAQQGGQLTNHVSTEPCDQSAAGPHWEEHPMSPVGHQILDSDPVVMGTAADFQSFTWSYRWTKEVTGALFFDI